MTTSNSPAEPSFARHVQDRGVRRWIPGLAILAHYDRNLFFSDLSAGLVLTAVLVPVGMGYAEATGLLAIYGLYATVVALLAYAVFGPSRTLVIGPDSALVALIVASVAPLAGGDPGRAAVLAAALAMISGTFCILAGIARFGFITDLLSKPIRYGYLNGIALTLLASQFPKVFGFSVKSGSFLQDVTGLVNGIRDGKINRVACAIGFSCLVMIFGCKRWAPRLPGVLFAVVGGTLAVALFDLATWARIAVVGVLPQGLPAFSIPSITAAEFTTLCADAIAIALVSIADMSVLSRIYAMRGNYYVDDNQEMIALGIANVTTGLFHGFSVTSSSSRTPVALAAGARTQVTGIVGAVCIGLLLVFAPRLLQHVPIASLGAVVISASWGVIEIAEMRRLYRLRRGEFVLSSACFLGVVLLGVIQGIFIAVGLSLLVFIWRAWRPYHAVLGRVAGMKGYHDITRHPEARLISGLILFRWDAPLFFANAEMFRDKVLHAISNAPTPTRWIVVAAEPITDVDITAADVLTELDEELHQAGIELCFAEMKGPVKDHLKTYGLFAKIGTEHFFPTIGQAVDRYTEVHQVDWIDWEDAQNPHGILS